MFLQIGASERQELSAISGSPWSLKPIYLLRVLLVRSSSDAPLGLPSPPYFTFISAGWVSCCPLPKNFRNDVKCFVLMAGRGTTDSCNTCVTAPRGVFDSGTVGGWVGGPLPPPPRFPGVRCATGQVSAWPKAGPENIFSG